MPSATPTIPHTHRALVLESIEAGIHLSSRPTPQPTPGSALVRILAANLLSYHKEIYNGTRPYPFPTPIVPGCSAIARIVAPGPDATLLRAGQLVFVDCVVRARDDPSAIFMSAISEGLLASNARHLMREIWRDGAFAEYRLVPLETCFALDEGRLCGELGYSVAQLMYAANLLVPFGGLRDVGAEPGQTVLVSPATGAFGGAGVHVAAAMGCRVVAMGRNVEELGRVKEKVEGSVRGACVVTVPMTGNEEEETAALREVGAIDAMVDLMPPGGAQSTHMKSALAALKYEGRVSLMGFADVTSSPESRFKIVGANLTLKGKLMYTRSDVEQFIKMLERGVFPKGKDLTETRSFGLDDWKEAFDTAADWAGIGRIVVFEP